MRICQRSVPVRPGLFAGEDVGFEQAEDFGQERGCLPEPLKAGEERREFVATVEGQDDLLDGSS